MKYFLLTCLLLFIGSGVAAQESKTIRVASKNFNENYLLAEVMSQLLELDGYTVDRRFGLAVRSSATRRWSIMKSIFMLNTPARWNKSFSRATVKRQPSLPSIRS